MSTGKSYQRRCKGSRSGSRQQRDGGPKGAAQARWRQIVEAWRGSGVSQAAFCRERGLSPQTFSTWKGRLARRDAARHAAGNAPAFVPVRVVASAEEVGRGDRGGRCGGLLQPLGEEGAGFEAALEVVLARGRRIRVGAGVDAALLATVVRVLEGVERC